LLKVDSVHRSRTSYVGGDDDYLQSMSTQQW